jgi:hypothetical protein
MTPLQTCRTVRSGSTRRHFRWGVAQLAERRTLTPKAEGSNPSTLAKFLSPYSLVVEHRPFKATVGGQYPVGRPIWSCSLIGKALACHARESGIVTRQLRQIPVVGDARSVVCKRH